MPTVITHAVSAAALTSTFPNRSVPRRLIILGVICAMAPDVDVFGFRFGIRYGDLWGHRGLTHSLMFAFCLSILVWLVAIPYVAGPAYRVLLWLYLFLASASHGVLDAFTNGGLGIASCPPSTRLAISSHFIRLKSLRSVCTSSPSEAYQRWRVSSFGFGCRRSALRF